MKVVVKFSSNAYIETLKIRTKDVIHIANKSIETYRHPGLNITKDYLELVFYHVPNDKVKTFINELHDYPRIIGIDVEEEAD